MIYESVRKMTAKEQMAFDLGYAKALGEIERLTAEQDAAKDTWTPIEECIPVEGEVVEIVSISKADRARYTPSNNPFWPWSLIDWPTPETEDGTFFRHREAVTHWRRGPEAGGEGEE